MIDRQPSHAPNPREVIVTEHHPALNLLWNLMPYIPLVLTFGIGFFLLWLSKRKSPGAQNPC